MLGSNLEVKQLRSGWYFFLNSKPAKSLAKLKVELTSWTVTLVSELIERRAPPIVKARRRFAGHVLSITIPTRVPRLAHAGVGTVGVEAASVVARP